MSREAGHGVRKSCQSFGREKGRFENIKGVQFEFCVWFLCFLFVFGFKAKENLVEWLCVIVECLCVLFCKFLWACLLFYGFGC